MDSVVSWAVLTILCLAGVTWLLLKRAAYLDSIHIEKPSCVWANAGRRTDWQRFATGN